MTLASSATCAGAPRRRTEGIPSTDPLRAERAIAAAEPKSAAGRPTMRNAEGPHPAPWVLVGHAHEPVLYTLGAARPVPLRPVPGVAIPVPPRRRWLAVVGSAGQPRDGNTATCHAMPDTAAATLTVHRVFPDGRLAAAKVRAAGLPESLARRLERGG